MFLEIWNGIGWWVVGGIGLAWAINRYSQRKNPHQNGLTWGFLGACTLMGAIFGSLLTVQFSGVVPKVLTTMNYTVTMSPLGEHVGDCSGQIDASLLTGFKKEYKVALACALRDPQIDELSDKRIFVSPLVEIISGMIPIAATASPGGNFVVSSQTLTIDYLPILVPKNVQWEKIQTLGDVLQLGGKILDPRYY